jgi:hypothetical protein
MGNAGYFNNIIFQNNSIQRAYIGIYHNAVVASGNGSGLTVTGNDLNSTGANQIRLVGIYLQGVDGATVSNNNIGNFEAATGENDAAIWLATGAVNTIVSGNNISTLSLTNTGAFAPTGINVTTGVANANILVSGNIISGIAASGTATSSGIKITGATSGIIIDRNRISNVKNSHTTGYGVNGIQLSSSLTTAATTVSNNVIYDIAGYGFNGGGINDNGYGIVVSAGGDYNHLFQYN